MLKTGPVSPQHDGTSASSRRGQQVSSSAKCVCLRCQCRSESISVIRLQHANTLEYSAPFCILWKPICVLANHRDLQDTEISFSTTGSEPRARSHTDTGHERRSDCRRGAAQVPDCQAELQGTTPLMMAVTSGNAEAVKILIAHGATINDKNVSDVAVGRAILSITLSL